MNAYNVDECLQGIVSVEILRSGTQHAQHPHILDICHDKCLLNSHAIFPLTCINFPPKLAIFPLKYAIFALNLKFDWRL